MLGPGCLYPELHAYPRLRLLNHHLPGGLPIRFQVRALTHQDWDQATPALNRPSQAEARNRHCQGLATPALSPLATPGNWLPGVSTHSSKKQLLGLCYCSPVSVPHGGEGWEQTEALAYHPKAVPLLHPAFRAQATSAPCHPRALVTAIFPPLITSHSREPEKPKYQSHRLVRVSTP